MASAHTTKATIAWLGANNKYYILSEEWLPNSTDSSPIDNVWSIMATAIYVDPKSQSLQALKHHL